MALSSQQFVLDILQEPIPSLQNFILTSEDRVLDFTVLDAMNQLQNAWSTNSIIPNNFNWIYLWGPHGSGKSHLFSAMRIAAKDHGLKIIHLTPSHPSWNNIIWEDKEYPQAIFIEQVHALNIHEQSQLFRILIDAKAHPNTLILSSGLLSSTQLNLREDVRSRISSGLNFELHVLNDADKLLAIQSTASARGMSLAPEIGPWLLNNFHRDLPSLLSLIEVLDQYSLETHRAITLPLLRNFLKNKLP